MTDFDRWYYRIHNKEYVRKFGPWLRRYENYRAYDPPPEAGRFGAVGGRVVELWYDSAETLKESRSLFAALTGAPFPVIRPADVIVPAVPTEDFLGKEPTPEEKAPLRWLCVLRYPDGVSPEDGEKWYLKVYSEEAKKQPGLLKYVSYRTIQLTPDPKPWHRVSELWYDDFAAWRKAVVESPPKYTPPRWSKKGPFVDMVSIFVRPKPVTDFLRDTNPLLP